MLTAANTGDDGEQQRDAQGGLRRHRPPAREIGDQHVGVGGEGRGAGDVIDPAELEAGETAEYAPYVAGPPLSGKAATVARTG